MTQPRLGTGPRPFMSAVAHAAERPLAAIADSTFEFIAVLAPDGTLLDANRAALAFARAELGDVVGLPFWETPWWKRSESRFWLRHAVVDAAAGTLVRTEVQHFSPDGRHMVVDFSLAPLRDARGHVCGLLAEGRDITERKRLEEALRAAERRSAFLAGASEVLSDSLDFEVTFERLAALIVPAVATFCVIDLLDDDGTVRRVQVVHARAGMQDVARRLASYPRGRAHSHIMAEALARGRPRLLAHMTDAFLVRISHDEEHLAVLRTLAPTSYMIAPLVARGRVLGAVAFCRDATASPYDEADLAMAEDFAHRAALALDNARLYEQSLRSTKARDEMLGVVSHDLRNPMGTITVCASALLEREGTEPARARHLLELIRDAADLSHRLIQDLMDVSAIEAGRLTLERRRLDPVCVAVQATELYVSQAREQGVTLVLDLPDFLPAVHADAERLLQVLGNLIGNAIKFTPAEGKVTIHGRAEGDHTILSVTDTGAGVPPEDLPFIFDRYWHAQRSSRVRGTGLGLAIVKGLVEAHEGRVWVERSEGGGSRFAIALPALPALPPPPLPTLAIAR